MVVLKLARKIRSCRAYVVCREIVLLRLSLIHTRTLWYMEENVCEGPRVAIVQRLTRTRRRRLMHHLRGAQS
jgi:hypothetical protein